jgi:hypothetical protein
MPSADRLPETLHYLLMKQVIETGFVPNIQKFSELAGLPQSETEAGLQQLAAIHGVILVPNSYEVWSLHPFSMLPTRHWVSTPQRGWWANCAWCSLAIAAALRTDAQISTGDGGEGATLAFAIQDGRSSRPEVLMHFPYPPARWWDNPFCPCGNILFFSSSAAIDDWCVRHGRPRGAVLDMATGIALATEWFGDYASPDWRRKTPEQARAIFEKLRLDPTFWITPLSFK